MTLLIAPDSFKGTFTAADVAASIATGIQSHGVPAIEMPVADGGEGTLDCLRKPLGLTSMTAHTRNPWGSPMRGRYGLSSDGTAVIEVAEASGITTYHDGPRDALVANTYGTGMLIADAVRRGARHVIVAAGGSATTDGGRGAIAAVIAADARPDKLTVLTDVTTGFVDAAAVFGPQKGADPAGVQTLARRLDELATRYPRDPRPIPGSGAAGGLAGGLWAVLDAEIVPGADFILDHCGFDDAVTSATAVIVGEGRLDEQTRAGKIISAILRRAQPVPVYAVVGSVADSFSDEFAEVIVASDRPALEGAGCRIAALTTPFGHR